MSELNRLIQKLCPDGVQYKALQDVAEYRRGSFPQPYTNPQWYGGDNSMPFVQVADMHDEDFLLAEKTKQQISEIAQPKSIFVKTGTVLVSLQGTLGRVAITQYDCYVDRTIAIFYKIKEDILDKKFFSYVLKQKFEYEKQFARGSTLKTITKEEFSAFTIPVPPIEVQGEIVRILDNFTELTAELTAELASELDARRKQYAYYCRTALAFGDSTPIVKLEEVASYSKDRIAIDCLTEDNYVGVENLLQNKAGKRNAEKVPTGTGNASGYRSDDILIGNIRPYLKKIWLADCEGGTNGDVLVIRSHNKSILTPQYLYCVLSSDDFFDYDTKNSKGAKMPRGDKAAVMQYEFSLPTVVEQQKAVEIINRLNIAYADICSELSAEIEARQKQYEYYRDKLLTFKELSE